MKEEFKKVIDIIFTIFKALDFKDFTAQVSLRDPKNTEKYIGTDENWEKAERAIIEAAEEKGLKTTVELGEAAFYGRLYGERCDWTEMAIGYHSGRL